LLVYSGRLASEGGPSIIHYGLHCEVAAPHVLPSYHFTKYDYPNFDINQCGGHFFRVPNRSLYI